MNAESGILAQEQGPIPAIRFLRIKRFRGIGKLEWRPSRGLNVIVGPGDTGKSTILEAIAMLFSPARNVWISEFDYFERNVEKGFSIEAVLAVGDGGALKGDRFPPPPLCGWRNGKLTALPDEGGAEAVLVCRLTGTSDSEAVFEAVGAADETTTRLTRALRQRIGLMRLGIGDLGDRDLRLVQGGALDRFMEGQQLRQSILQSILKTPIHNELGTDPKAALKRIQDKFEKKGLPHPIRLGLVGAPGVPLAASVGLMVGADDEAALPLPSWGTGTRRLASLELATILTEAVSLAVVDEPESGLEPYRQRSFVHDLYYGGKRQVFIATHAPAVLSAAASVGATVWRTRAVSAAPPVHPGGRSEDGTDDEEETASHDLIALESAELKLILKTQPEACLARLPVICEGNTEEGFATRLFIGRFGENFSARGIFCVDAGGHDRALSICQKMIEARFHVAAVVDDEGRRSGSWSEVAQRGIVLRWDDAADLEKAVLTAMPERAFPEVVRWAEEVSGRDAKHYLAELRAALGVNDKGKTAEQLLAECGSEIFLNALCQVACPSRQGQKKPKGWFKSFDGGYLLADKLLAVEPKPERMLGKIADFLLAIEAATA